MGAESLLASFSSLLKVCRLLTIKTNMTGHTRISQGNPQRPGPVSSMQTSPEHCTATPGLAGTTFLRHPVSPPWLQRARQLSLGLPVSGRPQPPPYNPVEYPISNANRCLAARTDHRWRWKRARPARFCKIRLPDFALLSAQTESDITHTVCLGKWKEPTVARGQPRVQPF